MASLKRKLTLRDDMHSTAKKHKPSVPSVTITLKPTKQKPFASAPIPMPNACPDYPNGFIYCHQCSKKRDVTDAIQCTFLEIPHTTTTTTKDKDKDEKKENDDTKDKEKRKDKEKPPRLRRCVGKFCKFCLINRYDLEFDDVVNAARAKKKEPGHVDTAGYIYKCPKCSETCNCPRCRKSKGLEPMGSAGTIRKPPPEPVPKPSAAEKKKIKAAAAKQKSKESSKAKGTKKPKPKPPLPIPPKWTPVLTNISLDDAETRFHIREFVLRFVDLMEPTLPKTNLEELEEIGGGRHQGRDEGEEMVSWVSEFCVKSIIVGLLNLVAKELHGALATVIKSAVKEIRNLGVNLNKIWPVLASLRDDVSFLADHSSNNSNNDSVVLQQQQDNNNNNLRPSTLPGSSSPRRPFIFTFPDPLPPPTTHDTTRIRSSTRLNNNNDNNNNNNNNEQQQRIHIAYSAQMVPVISALIEDALLTAAVREEIEVGVREGKETVRDQREAVKREAERWEQVRKRMETRVKLKAQILENRAKREYHKQKLISLENSLKILSPKFSPRFAPVGVDMEERVYWIIPPGVSEREAAQDFIRSCASDEKLLSYNKKGGGHHHHRRSIVKKAKVLGSEERQEMRSWSWFVAVWGKKPVDSQKRRDGVKLKIKVNAQRNGSGGEVKAKRRSESLDDDDEDMEVDRVEELLNQQDDEDEDEEMASVSDQEEEENRDRLDSSTPSSSGSLQSDSDDGGGEESDGTTGAKPASDETGSSSDDDDEEEQQQQTEEEQDEEQDEEEEDNDRERWWGFYDPLEILKLSEWIAIKAGLEDDANNDPMSAATPLVPQDDDHSSRASSSSAAVTPNGTATPTINGSTTNGYTNGTANTEQKSRDTSVTLVANHNLSSSSSSSRPRPPLLNGGKAHLKNLVDELRTFATLLEWRCREDKYELILRDLAAAAGGSSSVSVNGSVNGDGGGVVVKGQKERESTTDGGRSISVSSFYGTR